MKTMREQIAGRCKHFTGVQNKTCAAGVEYHALRDSAGQKLSYRTFPCFKDEMGRAPCDKREFPTDAEVDAEIKGHDDSFARVIAARKAIVASKLTHGEITCPCCGKEKALRFSVASLNGHIHAACTSGCVAWME